MALLEIKDLSFTYAVSNTPSIKNISLKINKGEFISICGPTGSGKSTLIKMLKKELTPVGKKTGAILLDDKNLDEIPEVDIAGKIGFVKQNPEQQIVTDKVWHEIAFGLENLGKKQDEIALRVAEISSYFGIEKWFTKNTFELSGGQKQLLNLASVMVMNPEVLILDEPTAQLDPIAASDFISTLKKINSDLSITIIIIEHRLEEILPISDRAILLDHGQVISDSTTEEMIKNTNIENSFFLSLPASSRLFKLLGSNGKCPLTIKDGRNFIESNYSNETKSLDSKINSSKEKKAIEIKDAFFKYEKRSDNVLNGLNITIHENEVMCLLGGNGSGKTTLINTIAGINKLYSGKIKIFDKNIESYKNQSLYNNCVSLLPQDVQTVFMKSTVREELKDVLDNNIALPFDLSHLYDKHPYDLSGGEQQLVAFAKVLATNPKILLMDEPTKGLDANHKNTLLKTIKSLKECGVTIIIVTHDVEFAADCADRCALLFRGEIVSINYPESFFSNNNFYTTSSVRMSKGYYNNVVTVEQLAKICEINGAKS